MAVNGFKKLESIHELHESVHDRQTLLLKLKKELTGYSVFDLMKIQAQLENEIKYLPPRYKKMFKEKVGEQLFTNYKAIVSGGTYQNQKLDMELYLEFIENFQTKLDSLTDEHLPDMTVLYHLCALYNIFITLTPPHPEGTPFPGGYFVEKKDGDYYCPVRDKQDDNKDALCRFCIAKQSEMK
ncbi:MAG: DUF2115 domain-containing protein [ANME-2 cluster archaeon]|nr:DUF2115 domain-containing protein [ANME-2 cluster archaeon]